MNNSPRKAANNGPTHVVISDTPYYLTGPQQSRPPEGSLKAGTKVLVVQDGSSYVVVQAINGPTAYITASAIKPIAPETTK